MALGDPDPPEPAALPERVLATAVDSVAQLLLLIPIAASIAIVSLATVDPGAGPLGPDTPVGPLVGLVVAPFVVVGYHIVMEGRYAETPGKRLFDLRVVDVRGRPVDWREAVLRNVLRLVDMLPVAYLIGGVVSWADADNRRLGDFVAGTRVVSRANENHPPPDE
jgi:uncharacterized RDD family membrane protein YckC